MLVRRPTTVLLTWLLGALLLAAGTAAGAPPGAGGHGWLWLQQDEKRTAILHLPARAGDGSPGAAWGTLRVARWFVRPPDRIAWGGERGERVYFALRVERIGQRSLPRRVLTLVAHPSFGGSWSYEPPDRPSVLPSLSGDGELDGFVGTHRAPVALLRSTDASSLAWRLLVLTESDWEDARLPWADDAAPVAGSTCHLVSTGDGVGLLVKPPQGDQGVLWLGELESGPRPGVVIPAFKWSSQARAIGSPADGTRRFSDLVFWVDGQLVGVTREQSTVIVSSLRPGGVFRLASISDVTDRYRIAPLSGSGTLALLSAAERPASPAPARSPGVPTPVDRVIELSVHTGRVLYDGPALSGGPVTARELQLLAALLVLVMIGVVVYVVRPDVDADTQLGRLLPLGYELADVPRRLLASAIDASVALPVVILVFRLRLTAMTDADFVLLSERSWTLVAGFVGVVWAHCTLGEWLWGGSIGKMMAECRVVAIADTPAPAPVSGTEAQHPPVAGVPIKRASLAQAALRNLIKWVPPLSLGILFGPRGRHLGDRLAHTAVIARSDGSQPT